MNHLRASCLLYAVGVPLFMFGCTGLVDVGGPSSGDLEITPSATVYRPDANGFLAIEATLVNRGTRDYYARVGDGFSRSDEQTQLWVAAGSDAYLEKLESSGWIPTERGVLIEGVSVIPIRRDVLYTMVVGLPDQQLRGVFRLRMEYALDEDGTWAGESWSVPFEVR